WMVVGQYDSHDTKPEPLRSRAERGNQEVRGRRVRPTKMMLAEKYAFEAKRLVMNPQIEIAPEQRRHVLWIRLYAWAAQFRQEFEQPRFDHASSPMFPSLKKF